MDRAGRAPEPFCAYAQNGSRRLGKETVDADGAVPAMRSRGGRRQLLCVWLRVEGCDDGPARDADPDAAPADARPDPGTDAPGAPRRLIAEHPEPVCPAGPGVIAGDPGAAHGDPGGPDAESVCAAVGDAGARAARPTTVTDHAVRRAAERAAREPVCHAAHVAGAERAGVALLVVALVTCDPGAA